MRRYFLIIMPFAIAILASQTLAQSCTDWSQSRRLPQYDADILGDICLVDSTTAYLAGTNFEIVDLGSADAAMVMGTLPLPAPAVDMIIQGGFVYLLLEDYGLVEVDVAQPSAPVVTRSYQNTQIQYRNMAALDPYLALVDDNSLVYFIDIAAGRPLALAAFGTLPITGVTNLGTLDSYLAAWNHHELVIMDYSDPSMLKETDRISIYGDLAIFGTGIMIVAYYENETAESYLTRITVDATGHIFPDRSFGHLPGSALGAAVNGDRFCLQSTSWGKYTFYFFDTDTGVIVAQYLSTGEQVLGLSPTRLAGVSAATGLTWIDIAYTDVVPAIQSFGLLPRGNQCYYESAGYSCWSTIGWLAGSYWVEQKHDYSNYTGGGYSSSYAFNVFDLSSPLNPTLVYSQANGHSAAIIWNDHWLIRNESWCDDPLECTYCTHTMSLIDLESGATIQSLPGSTLAGLGDGTLWISEWENSYCTSQYDLKGYQVDDAGGMTEVVNLGYTGGYRANIGQVVILAQTGIWNAFDYSDSSDVRLVSSVPMDTRIQTVWKGHTVYFANESKEVWAIDYSDPTDPHFRFLFNAPLSVGSLRADEDFLILNYTNSQLQLAHSLPDGGMELISPVLEGQFGATNIIGNQLYANSPAGLYLYDITDPAYPVYVGMAEGGKTGIGEINSYLVSEGRIMELDCGLVRNMTLTMEPLNGPVEIPGGGGSFHFTVQLDTSDAGLVDGVIEAFLPTGEIHTAKHPPTFDLTAGTHLWPDVVQDVPASAPAGTYTYRCTATAADGRTATASFTFTKLATSPAAPVVTEWKLSGWEPKDPDSGNPPAADILNPAVAPNPFNPHTTVSFDLPHAMDVSLRIYDLKGSLIRNLLRGAVLGQGRHEVVWNGVDDTGRRVPSGAYFYRLEAGPHTTTGRMLLVK